MLKNNIATACRNFLMCLDQDFIIVHCEVFHFNGLHIQNVLTISKYKKYSVAGNQLHFIIKIKSSKTKVNNTQGRVIVRMCDQF